MSKFRAAPPEKGQKIRGRVDSSEPLDDKQPPLFCFRYLRKGFSVADCQTPEKAAFADRLHEMSQLTWEQLRQAGRHQQGYEVIAQGRIRDGIPPHITPDVNLIAFRFCGKAPVVGYRNRRVFHVVWLDRAFTLYDHG